MPCVERNSRNRRERIQGFREIVGAWLLSHLLLKSCCHGKQAQSVLLVGGVCKFDRDYVGEVRE